MNRLLQKLCGRVAQWVFSLGYFPGQWRLARLFMRLSPDSKIVLMDKHGYDYIVHSGSHIAHLLAIHRACEPEILELIGNVKVKLIVDVGANAGTFALPASELAEKVIAIDADPELCLLLRETLACNGIENVTVLNAAVSDSDSKFIDFYIARANKAISSLSKAHVTAFDAFEEHRVPSVTLEAVIGDSGAEVCDILKIDAEGYSGRIIRSLRMRAEKVRLILCEPSPDLDFREVKALIPGCEVSQPLAENGALPDYTRETVMIRGSRARGD